MLDAVVISDFTSPFCWLAEAALRRLEGEGLLHVDYRSLELFPAPAPLPDPPTVEAAEEAAEQLGLVMRAPSRAVRTRKAHELARHAGGQGRGDLLREALFAAYLRDDRDIGRIDVLAEVARECGLDATEARVVLDIDTHAAAVLGQSAQIRAAGIVA